MKHEDIRELLLSYIDGETTPEENAEIKEHLISCKECQQEYEELKTVLSLFNTLEPMEPPENLKRSIMAKIEKESVPKPWFSSIKNSWVSWGAAAAVIVIVVGTVSLPGMLNDMNLNVSDANNGQGAGIMPAGLGIEYGIVAGNEALTLGGSLARGESICTSGFDVIGGYGSQYLIPQREVISLAVADLDASLEYIKNLVDDPIIRMENEQEAVILIEAIRDEGQFMESLGELGVIRTASFYSFDCAEEYNRPEFGRKELFADIYENIQDTGQGHGLPGDIENTEWQAAAIDALEIENIIMYEIRISVKEE